MVAPALEWGVWRVLRLPRAGAGAFLQATLPGLAGALVLSTPPRAGYTLPRAKDPSGSANSSCPGVGVRAPVVCVCVCVCVCVIVDESETYPSSPLRTETCRKGFSHASPAGIQDSLAAPGSPGPQSWSQMR